MAETRAYREYITESLRLRGENKYISVKWSDIIREAKNDSRTPDEIAADVIHRAGLKVRGGEEE